MSTGLGYRRRAGEVGKAPEARSPIAVVECQRLTDHSVAWNVVIPQTEDCARVVIGCYSEAGANAVLAVLEGNASWVSA